MFVRLASRGVGRIIAGIGGQYPGRQFFIAWVLFKFKWRNLQFGSYGYGHTVTHIAIKPLRL